MRILVRSRIALATATLLASVARSGWAQPSSQPVFLAHDPIAGKVAAAKDGSAQDQQADLLIVHGENSTVPAVRIVAWTSNNDRKQPSGIADQDILFARSLDEGGTWSDPSPLNNDADTDPQDDSGDDYGARMASDGDVIVAVWQTGAETARDIRFARSTDDGETWSAPQVISNVGPSSGDDQSPAIATNGLGLWVVVWWSNGVGTDGGGDIFFVTSTDGGSSWSSPSTIDPGAIQDGRKDETPKLKCDATRCLVAWRSTLTIPGDEIDRNDPEVYVSNFQNDTWTPPAVIFDEVGERGNDEFPTVLTDRHGIWLVIWKSNDNRVSGTPGLDRDLIFTRAEDDGSEELVWIAPRPLNTNAVDDVGDDEGFDVAIDTGLDGADDDTWVGVWDSKTFGPGGNDGDIVFSLSRDRGLTWSVPAFVNRDATQDKREDLFPRIGKVEDSSQSIHRLEVVWQGRDKSKNPPFGTDEDIFVARGFLPPPGCLDGVTAGKEECDDGNTQVGDNCRPDCTKEECKDRYLDDLSTLPAEPAEECDNGQPTCRADCTQMRCGDGIPDDLLGEQCDEKDSVCGDGCDPNCRRPGCGNGFTCPTGNPPEECDDGAKNGTLSSLCRATCKVITCGDGTVDPAILEKPAEGCDDNNTVSGDGCDGSCHPECEFATGCTQIEQCIPRVCTAVDEQAGSRKCVNAPKTPGCTSCVDLSDCQKTPETACVTSCSGGLNGCVPLNTTGYEVLKCRLSLVAATAQQCDTDKTFITQKLPAKINKAVGKLGQATCDTKAGQQGLKNVRKRLGKLVRKLLTLNSGSKPDACASRVLGEDVLGLSALTNQLTEQIKTKTTKALCTSS